MINRFPALTAILLLTLTPVLPAAAAETEPHNGPKLYEQHCATCHRPLAKTDLIGGRSASRIKSAVRTFGVMNPLKSLSDAEVSAISQTLIKSEAGVNMASN